MDLDRFRNVRVCLWVTSSEYLKKDHHGFLLELRPPHYFVKEKELMFMTWRMEFEHEFRFDKRHWEN
jgi:hypothetical protein